MPVTDCEGWWGGGCTKGGARPSLRGNFKGAGGFVSVLVGRVAVHSHKRTRS
jgi:hypothetical protein